MISEGPRLLIDHGGEKGIGDIVCELAAYAVLREAYPHAHLSSRGSRSLAWGTPHVDAFDETSPDDAFDRVVRFSPPSHRLAEALASADTIFSLYMAAHGMPAEVPPPALYVLPEEVEALGLEPDHPDDLIIAFSVDSKEPDRRWGEERFVELVRYIQTQYGGTFIELGSGFTAGHTGIGYDLVGQTDLRQTMALLSASDLFIGNHGGLTHLAGGVGTPILCPWGASTPYAAYAYDDVSVAVETTPACAHCAWTGDVLPACRDASLMSGRTPCTQEISLQAMCDAADELISRIRASRDAFRDGRRARRSRARPWQSLSRFDPEPLSLYANVRWYLGGREGWGAEHRRDGFSHLDWLLAFPDWEDPSCSWDSLLSWYVETFDADSSVVLMLSTAPYTGPEAISLLKDYLSVLKPKASLPKIMVIAGALSDSERSDLIARAAGYVALEQGREAVRQQLDVLAKELPVRAGSPGGLP